MAAVVAGQFGDERRLPGGGKAATWRQGGQATEGRVHKDRLAICAEHRFVGIHITSGEGGSRHIEPITALMELAGGEQVVEAPELTTSSHPQALASHKQAHGPIKQAFVQLELALLASAQEQQAVGAVGGEDKRDTKLAQPSSQA